MPTYLTACFVRLFCKSLLENETTHMCRHHCCQQAKEALVNVSHAYTLDHQQEEQLLQQTHRIILALKDAGDSAQLRQLAGQLHRMSAALRASLEQHVQV